MGDLLASYAAVTKLPIWITEMGTNDMTVQGPFPFMFFDAIANDMPASVVCAAAIWFCWSDAMVTPFGIVDATGAPKPSYYSFANYTLGA